MKDNVITLHPQTQDRAPSNPFEDQRVFMNACGQTTTSFDAEQAVLYGDLIDEEYEEAGDAMCLTDTAKELGDLLVVTIGMIISLGLNPQDVWNAVHQSNMSKLVDGKIVRREDGKILKPEGYKPPDMSKLPGMAEAQVALRLAHEAAELERAEAAMAAARGVEDTLN